MALAATTIWEIRTTTDGVGDYTNPGGFNPARGGVDLTLTAPVADDVIDLRVHASDNTRVISDTRNFVDADKGNVITINGYEFGHTWTLGWFEILSVASGYATLDRSPALTGETGGHFSLGGAFCFGGGMDDTFFDQLVAGQKVYIKGGGTFTLSESIAAASAGTSSLPIKFIGYKSGDAGRPTWNTAEAMGTDRPTIACGANGFTFPNLSKVLNCIFTTTSQFGIITGTNSVFINCKATNTSNSSYYAFTGSNYSTLIKCEGVAGHGTGIVVGYGMALDCFIHDSVVGVETNNASVINGCIIDTCTTGISLAARYSNSIVNNTIYGCTTGILGTTAYSSTFVNNIISQCTTGASWSAPEKLSNVWKNNLWNNTTNGTNVTVINGVDGNIVVAVGTLVLPNAADDDFRPCSPDVLRGGMPDWAENPTQMGAIQQKYQFANVARPANLARLGIFR